MDEPAQRGCDVEGNHQTPGVGMTELDGLRKWIESRKQVVDLLNERKTIVIDDDTRANLQHRIYALENEIRGSAAAAEVLSRELLQTKEELRIALDELYRLKMVSIGEPQGWKCG
jgi:hypothetical protein